MDLKLSLSNGHSVGFWKILPDGEGRFRFVNNTLDCEGPQLVVFRELPSPLLSWGVLPERWVDNGKVTLQVAKGTLVPRVPVTTGLEPELWRGGGGRVSLSTSVLMDGRGHSSTLPSGASLPLALLLWPRSFSRFLLGALPAVAPNPLRVPRRSPARPSPSLSTAERARANEPDWAMTGTAPPGAQARLGLPPGMPPFGAYGGAPPGPNGAPSMPGVVPHPLSGAHWWPIQTPGMPPPGVPPKPGDPPAPHPAALHMRHHMLLAPPPPRPAPGGAGAPPPTNPPNTFVSMAPPTAPNTVISTSAPLAAGFLPPGFPGGAPAPPQHPALALTSMLPAPLTSDAPTSTLCEHTVALYGQVCHNLDLLLRRSREAPERATLEVQLTEARKALVQMRLLYPAPTTGPMVNAPAGTMSAPPPMALGPITPTPPLMVPGGVPADPAATPPPPPAPQIPTPLATPASSVVPAVFTATTTVSHPEGASADAHVVAAVEGAASLMGAPRTAPLRGPAPDSPSQQNAAQSATDAIKAETDATAAGP